MKPALTAVVLVALSPFAIADNDTAYKALRVFGKKNGDQSLNRVIELRGRSGVPQPAVWKVVAADPVARGGVVEVEVQRGKIISERTPTNRVGGTTAMNFNQLNLDSDGAFTIANQEMQKQKTPFDRIDYVLRSSGGSAPPVWFLDLYDGSSGRVGTLEIAADTGAVLSERRVTGSAPPPDYANDRDYIRGQDRTPQPRVSDNEHRYSRPGEPFHDVGDFFHRLGQRMERRGEKLKNFFTGESDERRR